MNQPAARRVLILVAAFILATACRPHASEYGKSIAAVLSSASDTSVVEILISFDNDLDRATLKASRVNHRLDREENYRDVIRRLSDNRDDLERQVGPLLAAMKAAGKVASYRFFTVSKTALVTTRIDNIERLAQLPGARLITLNDAVTLIEPVDQQDVPWSLKIAEGNSALDAINIRSLWNRGLRGNGRLICSFDTGVDGDHPALAAKWRGNNGAGAGASWYAPHSGAVPTDNIGHGTHVMGIMVGSTLTDTIGVSPDARWICAAVIDQGVSFSTTVADILNAFDWALNPDGDTATVDDVPDVICNSWGIPRGIWADCDQTFWNAIDNVEAAGIVTVFAAGNEGPGPTTLRNPADRASSPINALSVGAINPTTRLVADFSSRGPSACDGTTIKPELVAPGVAVYSSYKDGGYKLMSGTSMAAPFVAGLVALMRQYNPDATVTEIKNALIQAAGDLGVVGEDNSYGHGLIDASRVLDFLPAPSLPKITVYNHTIASGGDTFADPGETAAVTLTLSEPTGLVDSIDVSMTSASEEITVDPDTIRFRFAQGAPYAVGIESFRCHISPDAISGSTAALTVHFRFLRGSGEDSTTHSILIGHIPPGMIFPVNAGELHFSASEFGQFGLGLGSIYQAGGDGVRFKDGRNLLFEAGVIVGASAQMVSDAIRNGDGFFKVSDFAPVSNSLSFSAAQFHEELTTTYADDKAALPIPVQVDQAIYGSSQDFAIIQLRAVNPTPARVDRLGFGLLWDFDINASGDNLGFDTLMGMIYQYDAEANLYVGIVGVSANEFAFWAGQNGPAGKRAFTTAEKYDLVNGSGLRIDGIGVADWCFSISRIAVQIEGFGSRTMAVVMAAGESLEALRLAAEAGIRDYDLYLDTDQELAAIPSIMNLAQNYPNPFNPETMIRFRLPSARNAALVVYNVTGQRVRVLYDGFAPAGEQSVTWDGRDESGSAVATGVYFYRLTAGGEIQTRKMLLLK